jgi:hypothetical protein
MSACLTMHMLFIVVQIFSVILINCGGIVELADFLTITEQMSVYVFDSHRPYHLANVDPENTQVRWAGCTGSCD